MREEHGDKRFCRREAVAAVDQKAQPQQAAPPPTPREDNGSRGGGRGRGDNRKKLLPNGGPKEQGDTEFTILNGGAYLGYEEMIYATSTGASTSDNLLQYLADGDPLGTVCAAAASGGENLASLFAAAATKNVVEIETLDDLEEDEFEERETCRPPGYCAQTILRFGGLDVMALLDGGATCSAVPEEVVLAIIGYALKQIEAKKYDADSRTYPIVRLQRLVKRPRIDGVAAKAPIEITYTVVLRAEFVPAGAYVGPTKDLYFEVFPKGTCQVPGVIIGFPVLDADPYGLGWVIHPTVHIFTALKVSLPRLELERRN